MKITNIITVDRVLVAGIILVSFAISFFAFLAIAPFLGFGGEDYYTKESFATAPAEEEVQSNPLSEDQKVQMLRSLQNGAEPLNKENQLEVLSSLEKEVVNELDI